MYMFWHCSKIKTLQDAQQQEFVAGAAGAASTPAFYGRVFNQIFNLKARFITGYPGQNEILLALENGEVEAMASPFWSSIKTSRPTWYPERQDIASCSNTAEPHPELKDVPLALDLLPTEADKTLLTVAAAPLGLGRPFGAPPGIPADRLAALRAAMMATFKDPAFQRRLRQAAARMQRCQDRRGTRKPDHARLRGACRHPQAPDRYLSGGGGRERQAAIVRRHPG